MSEKTSDDVRDKRFWVGRYVLAMEGRFPCTDCGQEMETDGERLALKCEDCCPK